jgi:hypothetical protein
VSGYAAAGVGKGGTVEERGGSDKERTARLLGRGRENATPVLLHFGVAAAVGLLVGAILLVAIVLWLVLR